MCEGTFTRGGLLALTRHVGVGAIIVVAAIDLKGVRGRQRAEEGYLRHGVLVALDPGLRLAKIRVQNQATYAPTKTVQLWVHRNIVLYASFTFAGPA